MNLRALVLLLLLANLGYFAWTQGWLDDLTGLRAGGDREPQRLARQFQPQTLHIVPADEAASAMAQPAASPACLEAGPFTLAEAGLAEGLLRPALPAGSWQRRAVEQPGVWLVYMGRFTVAEALQKKSEEMRRLQAPVEEVQAPPELAPGLSLGRFDSRAAAEAALEKLTLRGVRTARVVALAEPGSVYLLRIARADPALSAQLAALPAELKGLPLAQAFAPCPP